MLPDLPNLKIKLSNIQRRFLSWAIREEMGAFSKSNVQPIFEGDKLRVRRSTGENEINSLRKISSETQLKPGSETLETIFTKLYQMAQSSGRQLETGSLQHLSSTLNKAGQTIGGKNKDPVEVIFEMLERIQIPLDHQGNLDRDGMTIVIGSHESEKTLKKINEDPYLKWRLEELMKQKEQEARAREANRKLVG